MTVAILSGMPYGDTVKITNRIIDELQKYSATVVLEKKNRQYIEKADGVLFYDYSNVLKSAEVIIIVGGDGTVTHYAADAAVNNIPILGINGGHLGFLSGLEPTEISKLSELFNGGYKEIKRMVLLARIENKHGEITHSSFCVNDAFIGRANSQRMVDVTVEVDGRKLGRHRADGIIISTPTGSTAYSMSAGGPVVDPHMECIIVTPVCSHSLTARSVVCSSKSEITIKNSSDPGSVRNICMVTDSNDPIEIPYESIIKIKKAEISVKFISIKQRKFYEILNEKMIERNTERGY